MKLGFSTNAFKKYPLEESIKIIADIGYNGVEILCDIPHAYPPTFDRKQIESLQDLSRESNVEICNLNAFTLYAIGDVYHPSWIDGDEQLREARVNHTINCIKLAKEIGATNLSTEAGGPIDGWDPRQIEKWFIDGLARVAKVAEDEGVKILLEPEPGLLIENSHQFRHIMQKIDSDFVRLNFDIGHFYCVREDPAKLVHELSDYIEHFHLADIAETRVHNHLIPGQGSIDLLSVFRSMDEIGYKGFVTVELYPYQDNPTLAAKRAYRYLKDLPM